MWFTGQSVSLPGFFGTQIQPISGPTGTVYLPNSNDAFSEEYSDGKIHGVVRRMRGRRGKDQKISCPTEGERRGRTFFKAAKNRLGRRLHQKQMRAEVPS